MRQSLLHIFGVTTSFDQELQKSMEEDAYSNEVLGFLPGFPSVWKRNSWETLKQEPQAFSRFQCCLLLGVAATQAIMGPAPHFLKNNRSNLG